MENADYYQCASDHAVEMARAFQLWCMFTQQSVGSVLMHIAVTLPVLPSQPDNQSEDMQNNRYSLRLLPSFVPIKLDSPQFCGLC
jgi:hypothetical protein